MSDYDIDTYALLGLVPGDSSTPTVTAVQLADIYDIAGASHGNLSVLAPDRRDPSGMATVARPVAASDYTGDDTTPGQWTLTFADDVPGNSARLVTSATRRFIRD